MGTRAEVAPRSIGPSDAALVVAARAGEQWAREALFRRHARVVFGLAYRLLGRDDEVEDLVQESFAQALASLDRLAEPQAFGAWIRSLVVRTAHKLLRRRAVARRIGLRRRDEPVDVDSLVPRRRDRDSRDLVERRDRDARRGGPRRGHSQARES